MQASSSMLWELKTRLKPCQKLLLVATFIVFAFYVWIQNETPFMDRRIIKTSSLLPNKSNELTPLTPSTSKKLVLMWTNNWGRNADISVWGITNKALDNCPFKCDFTVNKSYLNQSTGVLFHGRDLAGNHSVQGSKNIYIELPPFRNENQLWVFYLMESPLYTWTDLKPFGSLFNLSMTYRPDSDVYAPYGKVVPIAEARHLPRLPPVANTSERVNLVAWTASNCGGTSGRMQLVNELKKYIKVDVFGACGTNNCPPRLSPMECYLQLAKSYKFYLAFENSLCDSYITEKLFNALLVGLVPVVYGYGDYSQVAPPMSYIDATNFTSVEELAKYLFYLDRNPEEYEKYLQWRKSHVVGVAFDKFKDYDMWCNLCTKIWTVSEKLQGSSEKFQKTSKSHVIKDLDWWWNHKVHNSSRSGEVTSASDTACIDGKLLLDKLNISSKADIATPK